MVIYEMRNVEHIQYFQQHIHSLSVLLLWMQIYLILLKQTHFQGTPINIKPQSAIVY
jgi:hypothetical protein